MMNLTMSHPVPTFGDSFTITCYVCGMPSSKEWAQKARSRPCTPSKPYFPFLLQLSPLTGAVLREDGSTYLCAFCHASLEAQWSLYESQQVVPPPNRKYNIQKFICGVCGVETYRKRIRALPFQEFPFLEKQRQAGSITLGNNPLAIVCLDCSETLWAQSAEYDRWGLPVHKRHFNWMARPPPPEDSVEATVARLPSGETQLPRCPPIEPSMVPKVQESAAVKMVEATISSKGRSKGKGDSPKVDSSSPIPQSSRKTSLTSTTPPNLELIGGFQNQQPPVVTVAPMSSHTTVMSLRKDSLGLPPGLIAAAGPPGIYPQPGTAVYPPAAAYAPYVWGSGNPANREATQRQIEAYPYGVSEGIHGAPGVWPWLPQPSPDMLRYQSYVSSLQGRSVGESSVRSPTHTTVSSPSTQPYCSGDSPSRHQPSSSTAHANAHRDHDRRREHATRSETITSSDRQVTRTGSSEDLNYVRNKGSPEPRAGKRSPKIHHPQQGETSASMSRPYPAHSKKLPKDQDVARSSSSSLLRSSSQQTEVPSPESTPPQQPAGSGDGSDDPDRVTRREFHIPKKRNWHVFMKESQAAADEENAKKVEEIPHPKKKKSSLSMSEAPEPSTSTARDAPNRSPKHRRLSPGRMVDPRPRSRTMDSAMDLSVGILPSSKPSSKAGAKFRIEYLCLSEPSRKGGDDGSSQSMMDDAAPRTSVIKCAPKVPETTSNQTSQEDVEMPETKNDIKSSHQSQSQPISSSSTGPGADSRRKISRISLETVQEETPETVSKEEQDKAEGVPQSKKPSLEDEQRKGKKEGDDDKEKGNSERQAQASKMNSDDDHDDDRKHEDLPNLEQFIKETVTELVNREKEQEKITRESTDKQKHFLQGLGLITPDEKTELEIKSVVSRHERKTLPPLQLRADCKLGRKIDKQLKELLLKVSLEDPSLFQDKPEVEKCDFMAELGMKTAEKSEKTKREIKWRVILMERMRREIRDATTRGVKHEWEKSEILKSFADCDLDSFFSSLSFAALMASDDDLNQGDTPEQKDKKPDIDNASSSTAGASGVCINYPKYIPSYASAKAEGEEQESTKSVAEAVESPGSGSSLSFAEPILKIPVLPTKTRLQSESSSAATANSDTDDSELSATTMEQEKAAATASLVDTPPKLTLGSSTDPYPMRLDNLIQCSTSYWEQMKQNIDEILDVLESSKEDVPLEEKTSQVEKIRKHLKSQLGDIKEIEKRLRVTGKTILSASRKRSRSPK